jgi:pyrophosphatase PpaX
LGFTRHSTDTPARVWICDVNGVLVNSLSLTRRAFATTAAEYLFPFTECHFRRVKALPLVDAYRVLAASCDAAALRCCHLKYIREHACEAHAYPFVAEVLRVARARGVRIGAVTSYGEVAEAFLVNSGVYPLIDCLVSQEEVRRPKPDPESLCRILALLADDRDGGSPSSVICVGDTPSDVQAGRAAGVITVGVTYGACDWQEIDGAEPDYTIRAFDEMQLFL